MYVWIRHWWGGGYSILILVMVALKQVVFQWANPAQLAEVRRGQIVRRSRVLLGAGYGAVRIRPGGRQLRRLVCDLPWGPSLAQRAHELSTTVTCTPALNRQHPCIHSIYSN